MGENNVILIFLLSCWPTASPVKRKRGRPKGSKKKTCTDLTEGKADSTHSPEDNVQREEEGNKEEGDRQCSLIEGKKIAIYKYPAILSFSCRGQDQCPPHETESITQIVNITVLDGRT